MLTVPPSMSNELADRFRISLGRAPGRAHHQRFRWFGKKPRVAHHCSANQKFGRSERLRQCCNLVCWQWLHSRRADRGWQKGLHEKVLGTAAAAKRGFLLWTEEYA